MEFILTDRQITEAIRGAIRRQDGLLLVDFPVDALQENHRGKTALIFIDDSHTVQCGERSARLSSRQYNLLLLASKEKRIDFEHAQDEVWRCRTSDSAVRQECSRLSSRLANAGIPYTLMTKQGKIFLESI